MKSPLPCRSIARALVGLAARSLPTHRADWAAAMRAELEWAADRSSAFVWALGCLRTALGERFLASSLLDIRAIRWALALWLGYQAEDALCNVALVLSYKAPELGLTALLRRCAQGEDYQRLIPLLDVTTYWTLGAWTLLSGMYLLVVALLLRRSSRAANFFILTAALNVALWVRELGEPLYVNAFSLNDHLWDGLLYGGTALLGWILLRNKSRARANTSANSLHHARRRFRHHASRRDP
jgi:hypothetical protein